MIIMGIKNKNYVGGIFIFKEKKKKKMFLFSFNNIIFI